jgi:hypothetical protein
MSNITSWSPSQPNGWWPQWSPSGRYLAYGNWHLYVTDMHTGETWDTGLVACPSGWASDTVVGGAVEIGGNNLREFYLCDITTRTITKQPMASTTGPNKIVGETIVGVTPGGDNPAHMTYYRNGQLVSNQDGQGWFGWDTNTPDGRHFLLSDSRNWQAVIIDAEAGHEVRRFPGVAPNMFVDFIVGPDGFYLTHQHGPMLLFRPNGSSETIPTVVPDGRGWEGGPTLVFAHDELWIWTALVLGANEQSFMAGRRLGDAQPILLPGGPGQISVVYDETRDVFCVAGQDTRGTLTAYAAVPRTTARTDVTSRITPFDYPIPDTGWPRGLGWGYLGGTLNAPGNVSSGDDHGTSRPILEGIGVNNDGTPWIRPQDESRLLAIVVSPRDDAKYKTNRDAARAEVVALANRSGAAVLVYDDHPYTAPDANGNFHGAYDLWSEVEWYRQAGCAALVGLQVYPSEGNANWQVQYWHEPDCAIAQQKGFSVVLIQAAYQQSAKWMYKDIAAMLNATDALAVRHPAVVGTMMFGWERNAQRPKELNDWLLKRERMLTQRRQDPCDRTRWPRTPVATPEVPPEVTPEVPPEVPATPETPPVVHRRRSWWRRILCALGLC